MGNDSETESEIEEREETMEERERRETLHCSVNELHLCHSALVYDSPCACVRGCLRERVCVRRLCVATQLCDCGEESRSEGFKERTG